MSADWPIHKVSDLEKEKLLLVQDGNHGEYRPRKNEFSENGISFIRAADLGLGVVQFDSAEKINEVAFDRISKGIGKDLDTIISTKGTVGKLAFVPAGSPRYVCSPQTSFWRSLDYNFIDPKYLYYEMQSRHFINQITSRKGETDMADYLSLTSQRNLTISVPPIEKQKGIVSILAIIDDKIELNRQINQTLEAMAQAIFKSWFVDFEPVKAKIAAVEAGEDAEGVTRAAMRAISGKINEELDQLQAEHPENYTQLKTTAEIFPSTMQDSELGKIPKGWKAGCFGDVIVQCRNRIQDRSAVVLSAVASGQLVLSDEHFTKKVYSESIEKYLAVEKWDFAYNPSRINIGSIGMHKKNEVGAVSPVYVVFRPGADYRLFIEVSLKLSKTKNWVNTLASGSVRQSLSFNDFASIPAIIPSKGCISMFNLLWENLEAIIEAQINEINTLTSLRDTLLPKLLSGEISFDAAEFAEE